MLTPFLHIDEYNSQLFSTCPESCKRNHRPLASLDYDKFSAAPYPESLPQDQKPEQQNVLQYMHDK